MIKHFLRLVFLLQPILAAVRPHPDAKFRPAFNWTHWIFGTLSHVLSSELSWFYIIYLFKLDSKISNFDSKNRLR